MKSENKNERKKPVLIGGIILVVLLVAGLLFGIIWINNVISFVTTEDASLQCEYVNVSAKMLGRIEKLPVQEGARVSRGQLLVVLDDTDLKAREKQADAGLTLARQNLKLAQISLDKSEEDFARIKKLYSRKAITEEQFTNVKTALDSAHAKYAIAEAQVESAKAQLDIVKAQILNTEIKSPIDGIIAKQTVYEGDVVQPGQTIFKINNLADIWVIANLEETKIGKIGIGTTAVLTVDAHPGMEFNGKIVMIGAGILPPPFSIGEFTKTTQRIPVKIELDSFPDNLLMLPGMSVVVKIKI